MASVHILRTHTHHCFGSLPTPQDDLKAINPWYYIFFWNLKLRIFVSLFIAELQVKSIWVILTLYSQPWLTPVFSSSQFKSPSNNQGLLNQYILQLTALWWQSSYLKIPNEVTTPQGQVVDKPDLIILNDTNEKFRFQSQKQIAHLRVV